MPSKWSLLLTDGMDVVKLELQDQPNKLYQQYSTKDVAVEVL